MDGDQNELGIVHEGSVDVGLQMSNNLDLNVEQKCCSPNIAHAGDIQCCPPSENVLSANTVLGIGTEFESDDRAYRFYNKYARLVGFNVRKDWINRSKVHGQVVSRKFICSKEGYRRKDKRDVNVKRHRKETRTGCLAHMIVTRQPDGKYQVTHFEAHHNHDYINPNNANVLNLLNEFSVVQAVETDSNNSLGPKSKSALDMLNKKISARESLDLLSMNYDNYLHSARERDMREGEAGRLLGYFQRQHLKIQHFFMPYSLMLMTRTNEGLRPFVQFLGVNQHRQVLIFAAAFLYDDSIESFNWLLRTFINAMSGKMPKAILTEQEAVIIEAVNTVLPDTNHRTCVWQLYENTLKHLSNVVKDVESFASFLRSSIYDPKDEEEFTHSWGGYAGEV